MDKDFNDLFNEFFKKNNIKPEDELPSNHSNEAKKLIDILTKLTQKLDITENQEQEFDDTLGKPDKIEFYNEGNVFFERRIWYTEGGEIQKLVFSEDPTMIMPPAEVKINLQKQLDEAVSNEEFEKAAALRDEIIKLDKPKRKRTKKTK